MFKRFYVVSDFHKCVATDLCKISLREISEKLYKYKTNLKIRRIFLSMPRLSNEFYTVLATVFIFRLLILKSNIMSKIKRFFKSDEFYLIEYILSKIIQFLVYSFFIVATLALIRYLFTCQ